MISPLLAPLITEFHPDIRQRDFSPECVVLATVSSILARDSTLQSCIVHINALRFAEGKEPVSCNTAAFSDARKRLRVEVLVQSTKELAKAIQHAVPLDSFWCGMKPYVLDGTTLSAMDTLENQRAFPQHGMQAEGIGFPIMRAVLLQCLSTGTVVDFAYCPFQGKETGEMALARHLIKRLSSGTLLMGDCYYPSFFLLAEFRAKGIQGLFQAHAGRDFDFQTGIPLGLGDHIAEWTKPQRPSWMDQESYDSYPQTMQIREVNLSKECGQGKAFVLVTTLLESEYFPKSLLSRFYKKRWKIEVGFRDLKSTFNLEHVQAKTPEMIDKMIWAHLLAYNILRHHMCNASLLFETSLDKISVRKAARVVRENAHLILRSSQSDLPKLFAYIYDCMVQVVVGNRDGRSEPRAVKKRPKPYPRLQVKRSDWHAMKLALS